jgi:LmbE family N-acetylglucosaminyl deacetylase
VGRTLLAVHAHPDDETIATGGILARYSAEAVRTVLVTCSSGDLGEVADRHLLGGSTVGGLRERELEAATSILGVARLVQFGYGDSGMPGWPHNTRPGAFFAAPLEHAAARLVRILDEERPQVVVTYDATGGYEHPDHVKAHLVTVAAVARAGAARPAKLYFVRYPLTWSRAFVAALRAEGIAAPGSAPTGADAGPDVHEIGVPDDVVTTAIDIRPYLATKRAALALHRSQMPPDHFLMRMSPEVAARFWACEFFSREYGPTSAAPGELEADLFDGLE